MKMGRRDSCSAPREAYVSILGEAPSQHMSYCESFLHNHSSMVEKLHSS